MTRKVASSRADWSLSGLFWVKDNSPAILDVGTSSKKVATTRKKVLKLSIHNMIFLRFRMECKTSKRLIFFEGRSLAHGPADDEQGQFKILKKNLYTPIASKSKNNDFLYTQFQHFFSTFRGCFH